MKSSFRKASICVLVVSTSLFSCKKSGNTLQPEQTKTNEVILSDEILEYDLFVRNRAITYSWTVNDTKRLLTIASADLGSAWKAFQVVSKIAGPGYGGAGALLAGIGGSLYTWWLNYSTTHSVSANNPNTGVTYPNLNPQIIGELHNNFMHAFLLDTPTYKATTPVTLSNKTYDSLVNKISIALSLPASSIKQDLTKAEYTAILSSTLYQYTGEHDSAYVNSVYQEAIQDGYPQYFASYYKEFMNRAANIATFDFNTAQTYCNLFLSDVDNQQSFTSYEKHYMKSAISIYKNSLTYWKYNLEQ